MFLESHFNRQTLENVLEINNMGGKTTFDFNIHFINSQVLTTATANSVFISFVDNTVRYATLIDT